MGSLWLHPNCLNLRVTHLLFADDLLVFSDGAIHSLTGIMEVMTRFKDFSRLDMNPAKSEIFFGGYSEIETVVLSGLNGVRVGSFSTRYLGLPLNSKKLSYALLQPFIERITTKLHSWMVKTLFFAGRTNLLSNLRNGLECDICSTKTFLHQGGFLIFSFPLEEEDWLGIWGYSGLVYVC